MTREEKINLLNELLEVEEKNDIGNLTTADRREFQQWINEALEQEPCEDAISRQAAIDEFWKSEVEFRPTQIDEVLRILKGLPPVSPTRPQGEWIPVKWHTITDEERQREEYPEDWVDYLDCPMPNNGQEILVTVRWENGDYVEKDVCYMDDGYYLDSGHDTDDGYYLDSGHDWVEDIVAWMPLPEPYKKGAK